jgi:hypothetical protein
MGTAVMAGLTLLGFGGQGVATAAGVTVMVDPAKPGTSFPADAIGLSYEMRTVGEKGFDPKVGNQVALFQTLGVHNIRIGGNTVNYGTFWQPGGKPVPPWASIIIGPEDAARVGAFAKAANTKVAWAVNLQHVDAASIEDQLGVVMKEFGDNLHSIQCGNEPNSPTVFGDDYGAFKSAFDICKTALKGRIKISGPDTYGGGGAWNARFADDEAPVLTELNYHYYTGAKTLAALLAPGAVSGALGAIRSSLAAAKAHNLTYRTDESNAEAGGGVHGVADVYAAALWSMHYALATAEAGAGINFHGFMGVCGHPTVNGKNSYYTPVCAANDADALAKVLSAAPEFYGLWMANHLGPGEFLPTTVAGGPVVAFAVKGDDGATRVALIEASATGGSVPVKIDLAGATGPARILHMTGPALDAASGVKIQGASVGRDGRLVTGAPEELPVEQGALNLMLPTGSAALITFGGGADAPTSDAGAGGQSGSDADETDVPDARNGGAGGSDDAAAGGTNGLGGGSGGGAGAGSGGRAGAGAGRAGQSGGDTAPAQTAGGCNVGGEDRGTATLLCLAFVAWTLAQARLGRGWS